MNLADLLLKIPVGGTAENIIMYVTKILKIIKTIEPQTKNEKFLYKKCV